MSDLPTSIERGGPARRKRWPFIAGGAAVAIVAATAIGWAAIGANGGDESVAASDGEPAERYAAAAV